MIILLIVKPKRTNAPLPPPLSDPNGRLGVATPEPDIADSEPDIVRPNDRIDEQRISVGTLFDT